MDDALKFAEQFRQTIGIAPEDVQLTDGSGLSRGDLVTPQSVVQLLTWAARQKWGADFAASLPVAGEDGTLENRMKGTAAAGRIHAKTGFVEHDEGLSGYATSVRGEHLIFSFFVNNLSAHSRDGMDALDSICVAMVEELGGGASTGTGDPAKR
jgi:serine-type D-Ala-D-Ala carboxypeptidase/endopeptidase (penicillin-binding protein 4)